MHYEQLEIIPDPDQYTQYALSASVFDFPLYGIQKSFEFSTAGPLVGHAQMQIILDCDELPLEEKTVSMLVDKSINPKQIQILN